MYSSNESFVTTIGKSTQKISNCTSRFSLQQVQQHPIAKQWFWVSLATILNMKQLLQAVMVVADIYNSSN